MSKSEPVLKGQRAKLDIKKYAKNFMYERCDGSKDDESSKSKYTKKRVLKIFSLFYSFERNNIIEATAAAAIRKQ